MKREDILAVIVTYFPDRGFTGRLDAILRQFGRALIVDNASEGESRAMLEELSRKRQEVMLIYNERNTGVAHALNQGCRRALEQQCSWVAMFDQDTVVSGRYLDAMLEAASALGEVGVIGCNYFEPNLGRNAVATPGDGTWEERTVVITSGSLLSLKTYERIGGFCDEFFIDAVDEEYCLRCLAAGFRNFLLLEPLMTHSIGNMRGHFLFGCRSLRFVLHHHPSWRMYYFVRNNLILYGTYLFRRPSWVMTAAWKRCLQTMLILLFEEDRRRKLRYALLGIKDSITGMRTRPIP